VRNGKAATLCPADSATTAAGSPGQGDSMSSPHSARMGSGSMTSRNTTPDGEIRGQDAPVVVCAGCVVGAGALAGLCGGLREECSTASDAGGEVLGST
jgi:hypothetical protein